MIKGKNRKHFLSKRDELFDERQTLNYDLIIQVSTGLVSFTLYDKVINKYMFIASAVTTLTEMIEHYPWISQPFHSVKIILEHNRSTLIPSVLYDAMEKEAYLSYSLDIDKRENVLSDSLNQMEILNIYPVSSELLNTIRQVFPSAGICHITTVLIESIWINYKNLITDHMMFLYLREEDFNILIYNSKQLVYSNAFHMRAPEDLIYFVIFVMEQLGLNPEKVPVILMGLIDKDSHCYELLYRYIRNLDFATRFNANAYSYIFDDIREHSFYPLLNFPSCGS